MKPTLWFVLFKLAGMSAFSRTIKISTEYLAEKVGSSQQTASRYLIELEKRNLIERTAGVEGCLIKITKSGVAELKRVYSGLRSVIEAEHPPSIIIVGEVFTGLGEGAYYTTREGYRKQFIEQLGFDPYPGTLNLKLTTDYDIKARSELEMYPSLIISGFKDELRIFGPVKCFRALINNKIEGAIVSAIRSHYNSSVVEVIAPVYLREKLKLKDGNKVRVEIFIPRSQ
jgi:riboflavin kinase